MDKKIALVDLDGTIIEHDQEDGSNFDVSHFGPLKPYVRKGMSLLKRCGYEIVIWTTRGNDGEIAEFLKEKKIPFDHVNDHPYQPEDASDKLYGDLIIDDRVMGCPNEWRDIIMLLQFQRVYEGAFC